MSPHPMITSAQNQRIKDAARLRDRRHRVKQGRFLIDGAREILRAAASGVQLGELFVCHSLCQGVEARQALTTLQAQGVAVWQVTPEVFDKLAFGERQEGLVAVGETKRRTLYEAQLTPGALVAVLVGLEKPGNVGAILRSADAAGVGAVIVADGVTDLYNPNCIRASLGTVFAPNVCEATSAETIAWLEVRGATVLSARLDAERLYSEVDYRGDVAIVLGSEAHGLGPAWQATSAMPIRIPMLGAADSLNVSATAAVLFYEALRSRGSREQRLVTGG
jgi:TrmH family RNA methyltransferase